MQMNIAKQAIHILYDFARYDKAAAENVLVHYPAVWHDMVEALLAALKHASTSCAGAESSDADQDVVCYVLKTLRAFGECTSERSHLRRWRERYMTCSARI